MIHIEHSLESDLSKALAEAANTPETANLSGLWQLAEAAIVQVPMPLRLQVAGKAILQLAEVYAARAQLLLEGWEVTHHSVRPVTKDELSELLIRQSMQVDFSDLMVVPPHKYNQIGAIGQDGEELAESLAGPLDKAILLESFDSEIELMEEETQAKSTVLGLADEEDVAAWTRAIAQWVKQQGDSKAISLIQLQQGLKMPIVEVWLGLILSQEQLFEFEQRGEFYSLQGIWLRHKCR